MDVSVVIPTKDRTEDLLCCIRSIAAQTHLPAEVIVIDDGQLPDEALVAIRQICGGTSIIFYYFKKDIPSCAESRNIGTAHAKSAFILILDDDTILDESYIETLISDCSSQRGDLRFGGVSGAISDARPQSLLEFCFAKFFFLSSPHAWDVTDWGFQAWDNSMRDSGKAYYLYGGTCLYRKTVLERVPFRNLSPGRTALVDVDFFMRAKRLGYYFLRNPSAKITHTESPTARDSDYMIGKKEGFNRCAIYRDNGIKNAKNNIKFIWASIGWVLRQFLIGKFTKGLGLIIGYGAYVIRSSFVDT
ncbi:MAG: glycosyltransferase family 2 protein [Planctomycetes bacterium]|nr:glycosyltransferase family 2 protein [Planctomycetota bacterium]